MPKNFFLKNPSEIRGCHEEHFGFFKEPLGMPCTIWGFFEEPFWETKGSIESALSPFYGELHNFILDIFGDRKGLLWQW